VGLHICKMWAPHFFLFGGCTFWWDSTLKICPAVHTLISRVVYAINVINVYTFLFRSRFFTFLNVFFNFFLNAKCEYAKIQRKIFLEDALAMIFIDYGLLRSPCCKISYFLLTLRYVLKFENLRMTVREDNSWIYGKRRQRLLNVYKKNFTFFAF